LDVRFQFQIIKFFAFDKWRTYTTKYEKWSKHDDGKDEKPVPLSWCFEEFQQPEKLEHGNEWYCPKCKKHQLAIK
jgi:ubiquitin C-terminal hydrolase